MSGVLGVMSLLDGCEHSTKMVGRIWVDDIEHGE